MASGHSGRPDVVRPGVQLKLTRQHIMRDAQKNKWLLAVVHRVLTFDGEITRGKFSPGNWGTG